MGYQSCGLRGSRLYFVCTSFSETNDNGAITSCERRPTVGTVEFYLWSNSLHCVPFLFCLKAITSHVPTRLAHPQNLPRTSGLQRPPPSRHRVRNAINVARILLLQSRKDQDRMGGPRKRRNILARVERRFWEPNGMLEGHLSCQATRTLRVRLTVSKAPDAGCRFELAISHGIQGPVLFRGVMHDCWRVLLL